MKRFVVAIAIFAFGVLAATPSMADMALATAKNCTSCHAVEKKVLGPSYKEVAAKYAGQPDAVEKLAGKIMKGGAGAWGPVPMPANAQVSADDAKKLVTWILSLK